MHKGDSVGVSAAQPSTNVHTHTHTVHMAQTEIAEIVVSAEETNYVDIWFMKCFIDRRVAEVKKYLAGYR